VTIKELCEAFIGSRDTKPRRAQDLWLTANKLPDGMVADYAPQTVEKAFAGLSVGAVREHYKRARAMFSYAVKKGWMATNPVLSMDIPTTKRDEVVIAEPETVEKLFSNALETGEKELLPFLALTFFGGIRPGHDGEMSKIEWSNVNGSIVLRANQTKTNRKREIKVAPNLRAWLDRYAALGGDCTGKVVKLTEDQLAEKRRANWKAAGFERIPQDIARHSFCSYLLARDGDLTAALAGKRSLESEDILGALLPTQQRRGHCEVLGNHSPIHGRREQGGSHHESSVTGGITPAGQGEANTLAFLVF
jgi:site-specific recombinase XerD